MKLNNARGGRGERGGGRGRTRVFAPTIYNWTSASGGLRVVGLGGEAVDIEGGSAVVVAEGDTV
jgi:hypothetical protein